MNNNSGFNRLPFNRTYDSGNDVEIKMSCYADLRTLTSFGKNTPITMASSAALTTISNLSMGVPEKFEVTTNLLTKQSILSVVVIEAVANADLISRAYPSKDFQLKVDFETALNIDAYIGKNIYFKENYSTELNNLIYLSKDISGHNVTLGTNLMVNAESSLINKEYSEVDITLKQGETLIIDSNDFTVEKNGENILWAYSGDWVFLDRDILELELDSVTGKNLKGTIIYKEAFL